MNEAGNGSQSSETWRPKVTALVPCYNASGFLSRTLDSIAAQTWTNLEVLIGDDCSTDDTLALVSAFAEQRSDVVVVKRERNLGWLRNSNDLMARATGELMFFAFHDDVLAPTYVERLVEALRGNPRAVLAYSDLQLFQSNGRRSVRKFVDLSGVSGRLARGYVMAGCRKGWWIPNRGLFRSWAFEHIGGIKPNDAGEYGADWTWLLHMALLGDFVRVPEVLCQKHFKETSLSKSWSHGEDRRRALRRAGIEEIRRSRLGIPQKAILMAYLASTELGHPVPYVPTGLKAALRSILNLPQRTEGRANSARN